ncbi:MAG TPA: DMT family transporter [Povalibacter sp.]|nr:DMT family transporter [Povalibacter sp.]
MSPLVAAYRRLPPNARGALWMLLSAVTFTAMTLLIKLLGQNYPATLQTFYRQAFGLAVMLPIILRDPPGAFRTTRPGILLFRALAGTIGMILSFYAYQMMPLADANALSFTRTLWLVPLAAFVLKERVGPRRITATLVGFLGAMLMLQPASQGSMGVPALAALVAAFLVALTVAGMKFMTRDHTTTTLMTWSAVLGFVLSIPPALFVWRWPTLPDLLLLGAMGVLGTITQACYIKGMAEGDAAVMAPVDYTRLVFAILFGYVWFHDVPNLLTMIGAGIIIVSTLYITVRESRLGVLKKIDG